MTDELEIIRTRHEEAEKIYAPIGKRAASHTDRATLLRALDEAQERAERAERNRDMWKGQCERQAEALTKARDHD